MCPLRRLWLRLTEGKAFPEEREAHAKMEAELSPCESICFSFVSSPVWKADLPPDTAAFLAALPVLFPHGAFITITEAYGPKAFQHLLQNWRRATGTDAPLRGDGGEWMTLDMPLTEETAEKLGEVAKDTACIGLSKGVSVERGVKNCREKEVLLHSFRGALHIDPDVNEKRVKEFCERLSISYRWHEEDRQVPHWRIQPVTDVPSFLKALPSFPVTEAMLGLLVARLNPVHQQLQSLACLPSRENVEASGVDELDFFLWIPLTHENMKAVASVATAQDTSDVFRYYCVNQGERSVLVCDQTGIDVYPDLAKEQMKAFCQPLGLKFRRLPQPSWRASLVGAVLCLLTKPSLFRLGFRRHSK